MARPSIKSLEARISELETFTREMFEKDWMHAVHFLAQRKRRNRKQKSYRCPVPSRRQERARGADAMSGRGLAQKIECEMRE
jgi:hypothetical protein